MYKNSDRFIQILTRMNRPYKLKAGQKVLYRSGKYRVSNSYHEGFYTFKGIEDKSTLHCHRSSVELL